MLNFVASIFNEIVKTAGALLASFLILVGINTINPKEMITPVAYEEVQEKKQVKLEANNQNKVVEEGVAEDTKAREVAKETVRNIFEKESVKKPETIFQTQIFSVIPEQELNEKTRASLVNIFCATKRGGPFNPLSGSGVIIDPRGVILTNAHVAEFFLLENYITEGYIDCVIRMGGPALSLYRAELLNISESWVKDTAITVGDTSRTGTGENDYALLVITSKINGDAILSGTIFPFLSPNTNFVPSLNHPVFLAGYPAEFLGGITIQRDLWPVSSASQVKSSYYFNDDSSDLSDLLGFGGSLVAQAGASGGAVVDSYNGQLVAVIVTASEAKTTADRDLNGLTLNHINRAIKKASGKNLNEFLALDLKEELNRFQNNQFRVLKEVLVKAIEN